MFLIGYILIKSLASQADAEYLLKITLFRQPLKCGEVYGDVTYYYGRYVVAGRKCTYSLDQSRELCYIEPGGAAARASGGC